MLAAAAACSHAAQGFATKSACCPCLFLQTDISEVVIKQMQERHKQYTNMTYRIADCRNMPEFSDCSFGHVLDKGACTCG